MYPAGQYAIDEESGHLFARLSGDFNPLHVDPLFARRLQFGAMVVHGVHHLLRTWDRAAVDDARLRNGALTSVRASFPAPVKYGDTIVYRLDGAPDDAGTRIVAEAGGRRCLVLDLEFARPEDGGGCAGPAPVADAPAPRQDCVDQTFPPEQDRGECPLCLDRAAAAHLFPVLSRSLDPSLLAQILACTEIVGMRCPGLHSVFSALELSVRRRDDAPRLNFEVVKSDKRFARIGIAVSGPGIEGTLDAFFRPPPVGQPGFDEIAAEIPVGRFAGQRALVVGGSRGIGETTAKILAAGGAELCVTYFQGEAEARGVCDDISRGGGKCAAQRLDVLSASADDIAALFPGDGPTHVYYFASPKIESAHDESWDARAFEAYCAYYLSPVERLVRGLLAGDAKRRLDLFYPSTVFIDQPRKGFAEYAVAKAAGEALCGQLPRRHPGLRVAAPRLPMMMTDQTAGILPTRLAQPKDVMLAELDRLAQQG